VENAGRLRTSLTGAAAREQISSQMNSETLAKRDLVLRQP
jgi:hypothetical protein